MKILLINNTDNGGGAALASVRLTNALNENGIYARLGVTNKKTSNPYVFKLPQKKNPKIYNFLNKRIQYIITILYPLIKLLPKINKFQTTNGIYHTTNLKSETDINWINNSEFDIVNLHWISDTICIKDIAKISKPIVWTMHDSWPCCGAEHHPNIMENDTRWIEGYYKWNKPKTTHGYDLCRKIWNQKKKYLNKMDIVFTAPSTWEHDILKSSALFGHCNCEVIPNIIDHTIFYPRDKITVRKMLGIPEDKIVLGFGAAGDIDNPKSMKGSYYLIEALKKLEKPENYYVVIFGPAGNDFTSQINIPFFASGYINNPSIMACLYSTCDIFVNPSLIESMSYTCLEAACCGVPSVAFNVSGIPFVVSNKQTGWLATPYNSNELVEGIKWCFENRNKLSEKCLEKSKKDFNTENTIEKYKNVYQSVLGK